MLCKKCQEEREEKDFYGKTECYKCVFKEKSKNKKIIKTCKVCRNVLPKGRIKFCSPECAYKGKDLQEQRSFILQANKNAPKVSWKDDVIR